jgi:hypothetical protein
MIRNFLSATVAMLALGFTAISAEDKKVETKTLEGTIVCSKCKLKETPACGNVLQVKEGDKVVNYYLADSGKGEDYHVCTGEKAAKVTGKIVEKDGKKTIVDAKVEAKK